MKKRMTFTIDRKIVDLLIKLKKETRKPMSNLVEYSLREMFSDDKKRLRDEIKILKEDIARKCEEFERKFPNDDLFPNN